MWSWWIPRYEQTNEKKSIIKTFKKRYIKIGIRFSFHTTWHHTQWQVTKRGDIQGRKRYCVNVWFKVKRRGEVINQSVDVPAMLTWKRRNFLTSTKFPTHKFQGSHWFDLQGKVNAMLLDCPAHVWKETKGLHKIYILKRGKRFKKKVEFYERKTRML